LELADDISEKAEATPFHDDPGQSSGNGAD
jgi:hypothetical protein